MILSGSIPGQIGIIPQSFYDTAGKGAGLYTVMRFFVLDSLSFENIEKQLVSVKPDFIEVLPA